MVKVLRCNHCGNMAVMINDTGVPVICCGVLPPEYSRILCRGSIIHIPESARVNITIFAM